MHRLHVLPLVTARGGSKGLPRKNVRCVAGKPLIAWTIEAAIASRCAPRVIVSTDDAEIAAVSRQYGADAPFLRPPELAGDTSPHVQVVEHALRWLADHQHTYADYILLLQPTSPLRTAADIQAIIRLAERDHAGAVVSVTEMRPHPRLSSRLSPEGTLVDFTATGGAYARRQDLEPVYGLNGALYLIRPELLSRSGTFTPPGVLGYVMPPERALDIDTPWGLRLADLLLSAGMQTGTGAGASV